MNGPEIREQARWLRDEVHATAEAFDALARMTDSRPGTSARTEPPPVPVPRVDSASLQVAVTRERRIRLA